MDSPNSKYSIAIPDSLQHRRLWKENVPSYAKELTGITAFFINQELEIREEE